MTTRRTKNRSLITSNGVSIETRETSEEERSETMPAAFDFGARRLTETATPTPSDIAIASAARALPIKEVAEKMCGLREEEYEMYGRYKAKVSEKLSTTLGVARGG